MKRLSILFSLLLLFSAAAWAEEKDVFGGPPGITADESESAPPEREAVPAPAAAQTAAAAQATATQAQANERLKTVVSLSFTNADLRNVLSGLAKTYGLNIIADEKVKGTVNLVLKGVTLGEALRQILKLNGYTFVWEESIIKVVSLEESILTEVLSLNFIQADLAIEFLKKEASETGVMKADDVQGGILVTDKASRLESMKQILEKIDVPPQQVLIQARLLDVTHTDQDNLGLKLSSVSFDIPLRAGGPLGINRLLSISSGSLDVSGPSSDLTTDTATATISKGSETLTATLDALIRNKRVKVLASPTVSTLNNVEAKITIGEKFPIKETTQTTTGTLQTTRFVDIGITLRVTPKINRAGYIQMQIHPEVSSVSSTIDAGPRITTREADTTIIIRDRESVVIAGLIKEEETLTRDRIPVLGHIPLLGLLFQNRAKSYEQKELIIVITPYLMPVVPPQQVQGSEADEARRRLEAMEIYRQAQDYEFGKTFQARQHPEIIRLHRAATLYEDLASTFPEHPLAADALWRGGRVSWERLKDPFRAEETFTRILSSYPNHPYAAQARRQIKEIQAYRARQERKRESPDRKASSSRSSRQAFVPPGFR